MVQSNVGVDERKPNLIQILSSTLPCVINLHTAVVNAAPPRLLHVSASHISASHSHFSCILDLIPRFLLVQLLFDDIASEELLHGRIRFRIWRSRYGYKYINTDQALKTFATV